MRTDFPDGGFMLSWQRFRAWFSADGSLKDCEYKTTYQGFPAVRAISKKHVNVLKWLEKQGKQEADLLKRGILKRKEGL